ncbi:MAG TPA: glycosyltransferase family 4 protein [Acidimicrobiales bacterium]
MRILVVSHYFPPEIGAPQARLSELSRYWAEAGHEVTVLTGLPNHPTGVVAPEYRRRMTCEEHVDGYRVLRTWLYATPNEGVVKKTLGHLSFMLTSVALGLRRTGPQDVVVVSSPTFFSIFSAWFIARVRRARFVVEIRDLWPAIFVELGVLTNPWVIRLLEAFETAAYRAADAVVVVTEGFKEHIVARRVPEAKVHTIHNGVDIDRFAPDGVAEHERLAARARLGASAGETLVLYTGAHGLSHGLVAIADAAAKLDGEPIHFAFVGEGAAKRDLEARVAELGLRNVTMLPGVPRAEVPALVAAADICLVPLRDVPLFSTFIPSKMFEYLAAGKAIVGAVRGEPAGILRDAGAVVVEPENSASIADAIRQLARDRDQRRSMGTMGRAFVVDHFDRRNLAGAYLDILEP